MKLLFSIVIAVTGTSCLAESGADVLLDQLGEKPTVATKRVVAQDGDAFQRQVGEAVRRQKRLPYDVQQWTNMVLSGDFTNAAHLWTSVQDKLPSGFANEALAIQLYLLAKLNLHQTFFDQWIRAMAISAYAKSSAETALEEVLEPQLEAGLLRFPVSVHAQQMAVLNRLPDRLMIQIFRAWGSLRTETKAAQILPTLPETSQMRRLLGETAVLERVKRHDLKGAAQILKKIVEPSVEASGNVLNMAEFDLTIARILYQAGQMKAAAAFYQKIPNQSPLFVTAHEELSWVLLRQNDTARLRGELATLTSSAFSNRFQPEVFLLRAVSDLKFCYYEKLDKDLADFSHINQVWAKKIEAAIAAAVPPKPIDLDEYSGFAIKKQQSLEAEAKSLGNLGHESIGAVLPAVGWQKHWKDYLTAAKSNLEEAKKLRNEEFLRQWKNQRSALAEAIRKMRFVKVEYMSQVRQLSGSPMAPQGTIASNADSLPAKAVIGDKAQDQMIFPAGHEMWQDELFKLRSAAQARCLKKTGIQ